MKTNRTIIATISIIILIAAVTIVSCQKEPSPVAMEQGNSTLARIRDFKRQLEMVEQNPYCKSVTYMSISDAVWNIEALFNYTYAYSNYTYGQTVCCDTMLYLPVCPNDSVSLSDLYVFNGQLYEAVLELYNAAILNNKQFVILDVEASERIGNLQAIELHTVQGSIKGDQPIPEPPHSWVPFDQAGFWYYGGDMINSFGDPVDAADTLSWVLNAVLVPKAPENHEYVYTNVINKHTDLGENHPNPTTGYPNVDPRYCEFYKTYPTMEDQILITDQMNFYYFGERHLVQNILPNSDINPVPSDHRLFLVIVEEGATDTTIGHHTMAFYGLKNVIVQDSVHKINLE